MTSALIIVDLQNDFLPKGALPVPEGDSIIIPINQIMERFDWVLATKDWHPHNHVSFASTWNKKPLEQQEIRGVKQTLWPDHCIENTPGSEFPQSLEIDSIHHTFFKGHNRNVDSYSAFFDLNKNPASAIHTFLTVHQVQRLFFCGLATDFCVKSSILDAVSLGYETHLILDCCRGISKETTEQALSEMKQAGVSFVESNQLNEKLSSV